MLQRICTVKDIFPLDLVPFKHLLSSVFVCLVFSFIQFKQKLWKIKMLSFQCVKFKHIKHKVKISPTSPFGNNCYEHLGEHHPRYLFGHVYIRKEKYKFNVSRIYCSIPRLFSSVYTHEYFSLQYIYIIFFNDCIAPHCMDEP